jgi:hypothetical protein
MIKMVKLSGGRFSSLDGGNTGEALHELTGAAVEEWNIGTVIG